MSIRVGNHPHSQAFLKKIQSKIKLRRRISVKNELLRDLSRDIENGQFKLSKQARHAFSNLVDIYRGDYTDLVEYIYTMEWTPAACEELYTMYIKILPLLKIWENQHTIPFLTNITGDNFVIITVKRFNKDFSDDYLGYQFQDSENIFPVTLDTSMSEIRSINKLNEVLPVSDLKSLVERNCEKCFSRAHAILGNYVHETVSKQVPNCKQRKV